MYLLIFEVESVNPDGENLVSGYISSISKKDDFTLLKIEDIKKLPYQIH